ncbi:MAG: DMT family transporter [Aeropyrum sp.]|nr:DMT family transporter [Aeropyrum sp.]MCE4616169.1 DMT family transporter [Aeropyrum sp.]
MAEAQGWLIYSIVALVSWGLWGTALKVASNGLDWKQLYFYSGVATTIAITILLALKRGEIINADPKPALIALAAGFMGTIGYLAVANSLEKGGEAGTVVALTALYPAVTVITAKLFLGEPITAPKAAGVMLAIIAVILLSR